MASQPVPVMGTQGYVTDVANKFAYLFTNYYLTDYNQSILFKGEIVSLTRSLQECGSNKTTLTQRVRSELVTYFNRYYDSVSVNVTVEDDTTVGNEDQLVLTITVAITDSSVTSEFSRMVKTANGVINKVIDLNNYGE